MKLRAFFASIALLTTGSAYAQDEWSFTLSSGIPFVFNPEVSYQASSSNIRYYGNVKVSLDTGAAIGFELPVSNNNKHALGAFVGTIGINEGDDCDALKDRVNSFDRIITDVFTCSVSVVFDWERVDGLGLTYSYNFNQLNDNGWFIRLEAGYGKGSDSKDNQTSGGALIGYRF